jgi:hypothetical protein
MGAKISFLAADASTSAADAKALLTVPATAVVSRNGRQVAFQVRDDRAVEVAVTTGQKLAGLVEIKSGLKDGEKVITKVPDEIKDGTRVTQKGK